MDEIAAWDINVSDIRSKDEVTKFTLFCEDTNTEPQYFRMFDIQGKLKIIPLPNQKQSIENYLNAVAGCVTDGKMEYTATGYKLKNNLTDFVWSVYDRDLESENLEDIKQVDDIEFTNAIHDALAKGINVAWSNDVFELWVLLHFEKIPVGKRLHRTYIYDRLTEILKEHPNKPYSLIKVTANAQFRYETHAKSNNKFTASILPLLKGKIAIALKNAEELEANYQSDMPLHERNPCTTVHHLVRELLEYHVGHNF